MSNACWLLKSDDVLKPRAESNQSDNAVCPVITGWCTRGTTTPANMHMMPLFLPSCRMLFFVLQFVFWRQSVTSVHPTCSSFIGRYSTIVEGLGSYICLTSVSPVGSPHSNSQLGSSIAGASPCGRLQNSYSKKKRMTIERTIMCIGKTCEKRGKGSIWNTVHHWVNGVMAEKTFCAKLLESRM